MKLEKVHPTAQQTPITSATQYTSKSNLPNDVERRWKIFKKEELSIHSNLWLRRKQETINLFEEFLAQEIQTAVEKERKSVLDKWYQDDGSDPECDHGHHYTDCKAKQCELRAKNELITLITKDTKDVV